MISETIEGDGFFGQVSTQGYLFL